tara:strand:+ start:194 stop:922 length:729 start_codon:yes stop_codon:yes gene_type:complete
MIKLVDINIEGAKHLDRVRPFLEKEKPDVICLQEVFEVDLQDFAKRLGMKYVFGLEVLIGRDERLKPPFIPYGNGILSRFPLENTQVEYYRGEKEAVATHVFDGTQESFWKLLLSSQIEKDGSRFTLITTHFTWTPNGKANEAQWRDLKKMFKILEGFDDVILCGDFNVPRGREVFAEIAKKYKDNIPPDYKTSIDANLHRAGALPYMVDGLFSTPHYEISNVRLQDDVSDHLAIVAEIKGV